MTYLETLVDLDGNRLFTKIAVKTAIFLTLNTNYDKIYTLNLALSQYYWGDVYV